MLQINRHKQAEKYERENKFNEQLNETVSSISSKILHGANTINARSYGKSSALVTSVAVFEQLKKKGII
jgi:adenine-specific DNA methylase